MNGANPWILGEKATDRGDRLQHQRFVGAAVKKEFPALYAGERGAVLSDADLSRLVAILSKNQSPLIMGFRLKYLNSVLRKGISKLGWSASLAPLPTSIKREPSPFTAADFSASGRMREFEQAFVRSLNDVPASLEAEAGRMLVSAVFLGGFLKEAFWNNWLQAAKLFDGWSLTINPDADVLPPMRWFPDPITARLLQIFLKGPHCSQTTAAELSAWNCIREALANPMFNNLRPSSPRELRAWAELRLRMIAPPFLVEHALSGGPAVSLPDGPWKRLLTGRKTKLLAATDHENPRMIVSAIPILGKQAPRDTVRILRELRLSLRARTKGTRKPSRSAASAAIAKLIKTHNCGGHAMGIILEWARTRLSQPGGAGGLEPASVNRYLTAFARPLIALAGTQDWLQYEADDVAELYLEIIASQPTDSEKAMAGRALSNLHDVVLSLFPGLQIDLNEIRLSGVSGRVDANIVTSREFEIAKRNLLKPGSTWRQRIPSVVLILAYRAGLRRNEANTLPASSLRIDSELIELTIRKTPLGGLKSLAGTRRLPLDVLLNKKEARFLRRWCKDRPPSLATSEDHYLFCDEEDPLRALSAKEMFNPIREALQHATGDPSIRFHNLRHSFATFLLLCLILPTGVDLSWLHGIGPDLLSEDRQIKLKMALLGEGRLGQGALYAVAQACGHSDVRVTLASYMHLADLALWAFVSRESVQPNVPVKIKALLSGITLSAVRVMESRRRHKRQLYPKPRDPARRNDEAVPTPDAHRDAPKRQASRASARIKVSSRRAIKHVEPTVDPRPHLPGLRMMLQALKSLGDGLTPQDCARSLDEDVEDIMRWLERSNALGAIKTQKGAYRHRSTGRAKTERKAFMSGDIANEEMTQAVNMWACISADESAVEDASSSLRIFAHGFQSTNSLVRLNGQCEHDTYHRFLDSLGILTCTPDWYRSEVESFALMADG